MGVSLTSALRHTVAGVDRDDVLREERAMRDEEFDRALDARDRDLPLSSYAAAAGIDTTRCEFCGDPLDGSAPWRRGLDGCGAHKSCLGIA